MGTFSEKLKTLQHLESNKGLLLAGKGRENSYT